MQTPNIFRHVYRYVGHTHVNSISHPLVSNAQSMFWIVFLLLSMELQNSDFPIFLVFILYNAKYKLRRSCFNNVREDQVFNNKIYGSFSIYYICE